MNELGGSTRHLAHLTEGWRVRQVEASLGPILQLSDETYFPCPVRRTCCRAPLRTSRSACPQQLAELLQLSVQEVCADFDAMLRHDWRRLGISVEEVREFCVSTPRCDARAKLAGRPGGRC